MRHSAFLSGNVSRFFVIAGQLLLISVSSWAQDYPSRNVTLVAPFPAGGGTDLFARTISQELAKQFGKQIIVENRTGASGNIGAEAVAKAAPDGYTLLYTASPIALSQPIYKKLDFDPQRDLKAISMTISMPLVLVVHRSLPARDFKGLLALAKSRPDALTYSSGGPGSSGHYSIELLKLKTGVSLHHVPYRGTAPAVTSLISGETQVSFLVPPVVQAHLESGKLRALGISAKKRSPVLRGIPTLQELGVADFEALQWQGFFAPIKTPDNVINYLYTNISKALEAPGVKSRFASEGADIVGSSPTEFAIFFKKELAQWTEVANRAGMKIN